MTIQVLTGSKQKIAAQVSRIPGEVREAIVFIEEPSEAAARPPEDIFAEMEPFAVKAGGADYSRESLYSRVGHRCQLKSASGGSSSQVIPDGMPPAV